MDKILAEKSRKAWKNMKERCLTKSHPRYKDYGKIGITIVKSWHSYENFSIDMGLPYPGFSLGRLDRTKGYGPENCAWMSLEDISKHTSSVHKFNYKGREYSFQELSEMSGHSVATLHARIIRGKWSVEKALITPLSPHSRPKCIKYRNQYYTVTQLAIKLGIKPITLRARIKAGWPKHRWSAPT